MARFRKSAATNHEWFDGHHRYEHWYRDNTLYFITARCRDRFPAFREEQAKAIFWDRFNHYTDKYEFLPWATTLMDNHYHTIGYNKTGENIGKMMQHIHGSVAKLVNDTLEIRHVPFFRTAGNQDYFDGCLRDVLQASRAYRYTIMQPVRAGLVTDYRDYPHTTVRGGLYGSYLMRARGGKSAATKVATPVSDPAHDLSQIRIRSWDSACVQTERVFGRGAVRAV